jgi:serine/threonine-protein kinase
MTGTFELERRTIQGYRQAAEAFSAATESDPKYAEAYVGLSEAYLFMAGIVAETECFPKARAAAETALRLDPANAGAHRNLAYLLLNDRPDLERSEQEYKLALKLDPHDARAHHWYAQLLAAERKTAESVREASRGYELDPASVSSGANYAFMLTQNNQSVEAERLLSKLLEREPNNDMAWGYLGFAKLKSGQYRESAHAFRVAAGMGTLKVNYLACAGYAMARAGDPSEAMAVLRMIHDRKQKGEWVPAQSMVMLELALGDREQALSWIERGTSDHSTTLFEVATDPIYSELHDEPAYPNLSRQLGSSH